MTHNFLKTNLLASGEKIDSRRLFNVDVGFPVYKLLGKQVHVPVIDEEYVFHAPTTKALLASFMFNRRILIQGYHGTGKSTHIEQVAARLNWPCVRINLDNHISRLDLIGRDSIQLKNNKQVTEFINGILPWAMEEGVALCLDEYDAGRPEVMFVVQRVLEDSGTLALLEQTKIVTPHANFRLLGTANTVGLGDDSGLYQGTQQLNQGQLDRWALLAKLNYLPVDTEVKIVLQKLGSQGKENLVRQMVEMANLTRTGFKKRDISIVMSPRTVINWALNSIIFEGDVDYAFQVTFLNKTDDLEAPIIAEYYQRIFARNLLNDSTDNKPKQAKKVG